MDVRREAQNFKNINLQTSSLDLRLQKIEEVLLIQREWYIKVPQEGLMEKNRWCPKHKCTRGTYDGLYIQHPPEEHDAWQVRKDSYKNKKKDKPEKPKSKSGGKTYLEGKTFTLNDGLKTALCTQGQLTSEQLDCIMNQDF